MSVVSPETIAAHWNCPVANVRTFIRAGGLPHFYIGTGRRSPRVKREVFEAFEVTPELRVTLDRSVRQAQSRPPMSALASQLLAAARTPCERGRTYIYFMRCGEYLKAGCSNTPLQRLASLQGSNPVKLEMLRYFRGTYAGEKAVLELLRPYHVHYEWFRADPDLLEAIEALPGAAPYRSKS